MNFAVFNIIYLLITRWPANRRVTSRGVKLLVRVEARLGTRFAGRRVHIRCTMRWWRRRRWRRWCAWSRFSNVGRAAEERKVVGRPLGGESRRVGGGSAAAQQHRSSVKRDVPQWNKEKNEDDCIAIGPRSPRGHACLYPLVVVVIIVVVGRPASPRSLPRGTRNAIDRLSPRKTASRLVFVCLTRDPAIWRSTIVRARWLRGTRGIFRGHGHERGAVPATRHSRVMRV